MTKTSEYSTLKIQSNFAISIDISSSKGNTVLKSQMDWDSEKDEGCIWGFSKKREACYKSILDENIQL